MACCNSGRCTTRRSQLGTCEVILRGPCGEAHAAAGFTMLRGYRVVFREAEVCRLRDAIPGVTACLAGAA